MARNDRSIRFRLLGDESDVARSWKRAANEGDKQFRRIGDSARRELGGLGSRIEGGLGEALGGLGGLAAGAGAAAGLALGAGLAKTLDVSKAQAKLSAQLGLTEQQSAAAGDSAGRLYADGWGDSVQTVNAGLGAVARSLTSVDDVGSATTENLTRKALILSETFDQDLNEVVRASSILLRNDLVDNAEEAFDVLTAGFQAGGDQAGDLLETVSEYAVVFEALGLDGARSMGLLSQGLQAGARDADYVADALKEFSIRGIEGTDEVNKGFKALGLNAKKVSTDLGAGGDTAAAALDLVLDRLSEVEDPLERNAIAVALFGTKAEDLKDSLFSLDPSEAVSALGEVEGAADRAGDAIGDSAGANLDRWKRNIETGFVDVLGGDVIPAVEGLVTSLGDSKGPLTDFANRLAGDDPNTAESKARTLREAVSALWTEIKDGFTGADAAQTQEELEEALSEPKGILNGQPVGEAIGESLRGTWDTIKDAFRRDPLDLGGDDAAEEMRESFDGLPGMAFGALSRTRESIAQAGPGLSGAAGTLGAGVLGRFGDGVAGLPARLGGILGGGRGQLTGARPGYERAGSGLGSGLLSQFGLSAGGLPGRLSGILGGGRGQITGARPGYERAGSGLGSGVLSSATRALSPMGGQLRGLAAGAMQAMTGGFRSVNIGKALRDLVSGAVGSVRSYLGIRSPSRLMHYLGQMTTLGLVQGISDKPDAVQERLLGLFGGAKSGLMRVAGRLLGGMGGGGYQGIIKYLQATGMAHNVSSTLRPGSITSSGNLSRHALGKAVDFTGPDMLGIWRNLSRLPGLRELIYSRAPYQILQGRVVKGPPRDPELYASHLGHVHAAYKQGTKRVPQTGPALVHEGERIFSAPDNRQLISVVGGMQQAASELLARVRRSPSSVFEDFSYRGMSQNLRQWNDQLADGFYARNRGVDFSGRGTANLMTRYLEQQAGARRSPAAPPPPGPVSLAGASAPVEIHVHTGPGTNPADTGRAVVEAIRAYERVSGTSWRRSP